MAVFTCSQCGHSQAVDDKHLGKNATCPKCKTQGPINSTDTSVPCADKECTERGIRQGDGGKAGFYTVKYGGLDPPLRSSALNLEWSVVDDPNLPMFFTDVCGVRAVRDYPTHGGAHQNWYQAEAEWKAMGVTVSAWEARFLTFNVWGEHVRTLSYTRVQTLPSGKNMPCAGAWYLGSDTEGEEHLASLGYIARVRTQEGKVLRADTEFILREAQRLSEKFTEEDLEPKAPKKE